MEKKTGVWYCDGTFIYLLEGHGTFTKGKEDLVNKFSINVQYYHNDKNADEAYEIAQEIVNLLNSRQDNRQKVLMLGEVHSVDKEVVRDYLNAVINNSYFPGIDQRSTKPVVSGVMNLDDMTKECARLLLRNLDS